MTQKDSLNIRDKGDKMKTKLMLLLFALTLGACKSDNDTPEDRAKRMGLECINGWVFQIHYRPPFFWEPENNANTPKCRMPKWQSRSKLKDSK